MAEIKKGPRQGLLLENRTNTNDLQRHNITNPVVMQASVYPPGWLLARVRQAPPANPITRRQGLALLNLIRVMGLEAYRGYKKRLSIPFDLPIHRLTKGEAWRLIDAITADLEAQNANRS